MDFLLQIFFEFCVNACVILQVEVMHVAEKVDSTWDNCDSDGSDSVDVEEAGWKGDVESPLMPVEQTPLSSGRRAMRALKRPRY